jgi:hypothetical protein
LTFLFRISSAFFVAGALVLTLAAHRREWRERWVLLRALGPVVVTAVLWWGHPHKIEGAIDYFSASAPAFSAFTLPNVLHYWGQVLQSYTLGWGVGAVVTLGLGLSVLQWVRRRDPRVGFLLFLVLTTWVLLVLKRQTGARLFYVALPPAFLLASRQAVLIWRTVVSHSRPSRLLAIGTVSVWGAYLVAILGIRVLTLPLLLASSSETDPALAEVTAWIAARTSSSAERIFLVNGWDQFSAPALEWGLWETRWLDEGHSLEVLHVGLEDPEECPTCVEAFRTEVMEEPGAHIVYLENAPVPAAGAWWAYSAALAPCWEGEWDASAAFSIPLWPRELIEEIMTHPERFVARAQREAARRSRYVLSLGVRTAAWDGCLDI